jgi:two-component system KDP operon response regulator KdpE
VTTPKILVVSNLQAAASFWFSFPRSHWDIVLESRLTSITQRLSETTPDLLVIEIDNAEFAGLDLIRKVRGEAVIPILLITSIISNDFLMEAYDVGVDDCILKPINPYLLFAKFKAWLRHSRSIPVGLLDPLIVSNIELIPTERTVVINSGEPIHLTNLEFRLLHFLLSRRIHVMTTEELCQRVWIDRDGGDAEALKNVIYRLRRKIEADPHFPQYLRTVAGIGYEFVVQP